MENNITTIHTEVKMKDEKINAITEILNRLMIHHGYSTDEAAQDIYELFNDNIGGQDESNH
jgi:hypothetical protein